MSCLMIVLSVHSCVSTKIDFFLNDGFSNWMQFFWFLRHFYLQERFCVPAPLQTKPLPISLATQHLKPLYCPMVTVGRGRMGRNR